MEEDPEGVPRAESEVITTSQMLAALPAPRSSSEIISPSAVFVDLMMLSPIKPEKQSKQLAAAPSSQRAREEPARKEAPVAAPDCDAAATLAASKLGKSLPARGMISEIPRPLKQGGLDAMAGCRPWEQQPSNAFLMEAQQAASAAMAMASSGNTRQWQPAQQLFPRPPNQLHPQPYQPPGTFMQQASAIIGASPTAGGRLVPQMSQQSPLSPARVTQCSSAHRPASLQCQAGFLSAGAQLNRGAQSSQVLGLRSLNLAPSTPSRPKSRGFLDALAGARLSARRPSISGIAPMSCGPLAARVPGLQRPLTPPQAALGLARRPGLPLAHAAATRPPVPLRGSRLTGATPTPLHRDPSPIRAAASRGPHINLNSWQQQSTSQIMSVHQQQPYHGAPPLVGGGGGRLLSPGLHQHGPCAPPGIFLQPALASAPQRTLMQPAAAASPLPPAMPFNGGGSQLKPGGLPHYMGFPGPRNHIKF